ncbi:PREDICTED: ribosome biogenesis protein BRX1 homolog isoform X2 [Acropora digitifera]|uniref:ribosome biogenesis protein BRX1 homolog isoform X2 n=1 Tax=Acropora digitifera TaxID=70779 RepID=UPI00077A268C|nr:PREDICTED: ribosome biogenesis protein BRX1 homolog isoform X2 [Acropora digitifera]
MLLASCNLAFKIQRKVEESEDPESITDTNGVQTKKTKVKKGKWTNKQRVMMFCARGIYLQVRKEPKLDCKEKPFVVNEHLKNRNKPIFFEM